MTIPETLAEMRFLMHRKTTLQDQLERARSAATTSGGIGDRMLRGNAQEPKLERYGLYIAELSAQIDTIDRKLAIYAEDLQKIISSIPGLVDRAALYKRYIECKSVRRVAKELSYSREWMYTYLKNAEKKWLS